MISNSIHAMICLQTYVSQVHQFQPVFTISILSHTCSY